MKTAKRFINDYNYRAGVGLLALAAIGISASGVHAAPAVVDETVIESKSPDGTGYRAVKVVEGLEHPWAITWLPDGRKLVTERPGRIQLVDGDKIVALDGLPTIYSDEDQLTAPQGGNQGGLLDIVVHPDYAENGWIYFTFSSPGDDDAVAGDDETGTATALARARLNDEGTALVDVEYIYLQAPVVDPGRHYGSRIVFPGDGSVVFSIGDRGLRKPAQDLTDPAGSMIRVNEGGGAHEGNPFIQTPPGNLRPEIYSYGHRNNQGLAIHPESGEIWASGHGPSGGDLLYRVEKGKNYGWPQVAFGGEYSSSIPIGIGTSAPGVQRPAFVWPDSMAPSGLAFYSGDKFPDWKNDLFTGFLLAEQVSRLVVEDGKVTHEEVLFKNELGRIRDVRTGPDGYLYVATDASDGAVYRIEPAPDAEAKPVDGEPAKATGLSADAFDEQYGRRPGGV